MHLISQSKSKFKAVETYNNTYYKSPTVGNCTERIEKVSKSSLTDWKNWNKASISHRQSGNIQEIVLNNDQKNFGRNEDYISNILNKESNRICRVDSGPELIEKIGTKLASVTDSREKYKKFNDQNNFGRNENYISNPLNKESNRICRDDSGQELMEQS